MKKKIKECVIPKVKYLWLFLCMVCTSSIVNFNEVFAATPTPTPAPEGENLSENILFTGTSSLITNASGAITGISAGLTALLLVFNFFKLQATDDEGDAKMIKKKLKKIAICGVLVFTVSGLFTLILSYYK